MATKTSALRLFLSAAVLAAGLITSCQQLDKRLEELETRVSNLETVSEYIQKVIRENKIIREVEENGDTFVLHFTDDTSVTIDNTSGEVQEIEIRQDKGTVVITLSDGKSYTIPLWFVVPSGITLSSAHKVMLGFGGTAKVPFRINPSNATFNPENLSLVTDSKCFALEEIQAQEGGAFVAVLRDLSVSSEYESEAYFLLAATDAAGEDVTISSNAFEVSSVSIQGLNTGLPVVVLNTPNAAPIVSKEDWMEGATVTIYNPDGSIDLEGTLSVKGRGNSTWTQFPKKPYSMKLDTKSKVLGMAKHKRWCLLANWMDRTMMRNDIAFEISRRTGLAWTPSGKFVELILNGEHKGNYYLCEQIKVDENRVNISNEGFVFECDLWYDEQFKFMTALHNVPWQFKDPDEVTQEQFDYIYAYAADFEHSLFDADSFAARDYLNYVEPGSFVDWWLVNELAQNSEINQPKSAYMYKEKDGKLVAGPVWDFDWGTFIPKDKYNYVSMGQKYYVYQMFQDKEFRKLIKERWQLYKAALAGIPEYIDSVAATLKESDKINSVMWPINRTTNQDESLSYAEAVARLKQAYEGKYQWLDNNINQF